MDLGAHDSEGLTVTVQGPGMSGVNVTHVLVVTWRRKPDCRELGMCEGENQIFLLVHSGTEVVLQRMAPTFLLKIGKHGGKCGS